MWLGRGGTYERERGGEMESVFRKLVGVGGEDG